MDSSPEPARNKSARFWRELVNAVNPRLVLCTRAGLLAVTILVLNYAIVVALTTVLMQICSEISTVDRTEPTTRGDFLAYESFINRTLAREGSVSSGGITITTSVTGCAKRSTASIVAPHPGQALGIESGAAPISYAAYVGSGIVAEVPCWNQYLPCWRDSDKDFYDDVSGLDCDWYHTPEAQALPEVSAEMPAKADRFQWCSQSDEQAARSRFLSMQSLTSQLSGGPVDMSVYCGGNIGVYPGGVRTPSLSPLPAIGNQGTLTPFTTYWDLTVTTTTKTCPTFYAAFANSFAFAAQIEILITVVLIYAFKKGGVIKDAEGVLDVGAGGIMSADTVSTLRGATA